MTAIGALGRRKATSLAYYAMVAPVVALFGFMLVWPLLDIVLRSLNERGRASLGDGLFWGHYLALATDSLLRQVVLHSLMLAALATVITALLAFPTAYIISRLPRQISSVVMITILMPFWVSIIVRLFAFTTILGQQGIINSALSLIGLGPYPLLYNTFATTVGMVAYLIPYLVLILTSAMQSVDSSLLTAARTMGASERAIFLDVYFPQVRPALFSGCVLVFVLALGFFLTPAILGGPSDLTIPIFIQQQVQIYQWGKAAAMGIVLLVASLVGYMLALKVGGRGILSPAEHGVRGAGAAEELKFTPAMIVCCIAMAFVLLVQVAPLLVVLPTAFTETTQIRFPPVGFSWRWFVEVITSEDWRRAFLKSVRIGVMVAILSTLLGLSLARGGTRMRSLFARSAIQIIAIAPLVVPVIMLAIGIFDVQARIGLIDSDVGLVLAHSLLCVPLTFLVLGNALSIIDISMEQASWTMGAGHMRTFWSIIVPQLIPGIIGSLTISFVTSWDETVISMFQTQLSKTLPVTVYSLMRSGITPAVSAVSAIVITPVLLGTLVFGVWSYRKSITRNRQVSHS
ncbi:ABC transporter permease subunit [Mesorhizobium sp.]|uniref:ABC transporter permease subunit n=1 Tax=Mesorhizobium sp. TaxID=1871066 RepID=UPI000FEA2760|nr:ABC transporter permease subunit [Mesorhizobium sp.]RWB70013.1 MAG: ABC transporter permease subunit [Mesorhizobium sp.]